MTRTLLLLGLLAMLAGCRSSDTKSTTTTTGPAPLQITQGPPPSYFQMDNVDSNTSLRTRQSP